MDETGTCQRQAQRFLEKMEKMTPESQQAFRKIYRLAPKGPRSRSPGFSGHHVRVAMIEALAHPQIADWVRLNLAVRVARKLAQTTGRLDKAQSLSNLLETFHVATDAFVLKIPVDLAILHRAGPGHTGNGSPFPPQAELSGNWVSEGDLAQIRQFKSKLIPGFIGAIRRKYQFNRDVDGDFAGA